MTQNTNGRDGAVLSRPGKVAVVTGASTGIGEASARRLCADGWTVYAVARRAERLEALARETGAIAAPCDITSEADVAALRDEVLGEQGRVDALLNISGGARGTDWVAEAKDEDWEWMYRVNVLGTMRITRAFLPALRENGQGTVLTSPPWPPSAATRAGAGTTRRSSPSTG
ncbi:SDR family oxidoreductase [Geodermatophilus chilensis]|uniref:SDR family oxidoreductase n=1 Tax=Geodermatophilus chilensis TaxID=2035835 RepID=UPI0022B7FC83|nr:SDR family NAD(P)-dependent oxidoreductase [Geodermatophilus chilensis]